MSEKILIEKALLKALYQGLCSAGHDGGGASHCDDCRAALKAEELIRESEKP